MDNETKYGCSKCGKQKSRGEFHETNGTDRKKKVTAHCAECRKEARYTKLFPDQTCAQCFRHRKLDLHSVCVECNADSALRQCTKCLDTLPMYFSFYGIKRVCKTCEPVLRRRRAEEAKRRAESESRAQQSL